MIKPDAVKLGQESVWAYPRPAVAEKYDGHIKIVHHGTVLAETRRAVRTLETSHPPSYYIPREDIAMQWLLPSARSSICEWKGQATYFHADLGGGALNDVGWSYTSPTEAFMLLKDHIAFYAAPFDACFVAGEKVTPQAGSFYGGWITSRIAGPFKGAPGTVLW